MGQSVREVLAKLKGTKKVKGAPPRKNKGGNLGRERAREVRSRYWRSGRLQRRKVRNLVRCCGMTWDAATALWEATRKRRV
jgi:hypothetical protein